MNHPRQKYFRAIARSCLLALLVPGLPAGAFAQADGAARWLLVFENSTAMQKRLPATADVFKNLFDSSAAGQLHAGDCIAIWTCDEKLHTGQAPLTTWLPAQATALTSNLLGFLQRQKPAGDAQLAALQPLLNTVVADSPRLTVVIFCSGESDLTATPYSAGINQNFLDARGERKKSGQPFVVVLRSAAGKYLGCTVNYPPGAVNQPPFPPPPAPPMNPPPVVALVKPAPVVVPDLVIVGTNVGKLAVSAPPEPKFVAPQPAHIDSQKTIAPAGKAIAKTEVPTPAKPVTAATVPTIVNPPAPAKETVRAVAQDKLEAALPRWKWIAGGLLALAAVMVMVWIFRPGRRAQSSLITSSMQDEPRRK